MPKTQKRAPQKRADQSDNATKRTSTRTTTRKGKTSGNAGKAVTVDAAVSMEITEVWVLYQGQPSDLIRNHLIENYLPLVRYTAERMHTVFPRKSMSRISCHPASSGSWMPSMPSISIVA